MSEQRTDLSTCADGDLLAILGDGAAAAALKHSACGELIGRCFPRLAGEARLLLRDRPNAALEPEDLAQEAIARALSRAGGFDPARPLWPWLRKLLHNLAIDHWRRARRERGKQRGRHGVLVPRGSSPPWRARR